MTTWELQPGERGGDYKIVDVGSNTTIASLGYLGPDGADCVRYLIERANEGNAAYNEKLAAEGKLEIGQVMK